MPWAWESWPDYAAHLRGLRLGVNVGALLSHSLLRQYVMGAEAWERAAVPALTVTLVHRPGFPRSTAAERFATRLAAEGRRAGARLRRMGLG